MANHGIRFGDNTTVTGSAIVSGDRNTTTVGTTSAPPAPESSGDTAGKSAENRCDVGVVTILAEEARAVRESLGLTGHKSGGLFFDLGEVAAEGSRPLRVAALRAHGQGQRSAMAALENLRRHHDPAVLALAGVAGGIGTDGYIGVGDVVVATRVVYYDLRKETPEGVQHRGEEREAPAGVVHAVNAFFTDHGEPAVCTAPGTAREFSAAPGPIGSGEAVVADAESEIRAYLSRYNDKILAVDMEAGGLSQHWQENSVRAEPNPGWVVVRGISDGADKDKGHAHHDTAARNAAEVLRRLLPYLC